MKLNFKQQLHITDCYRVVEQTKRCYKLTKKIAIGWLPSFCLNPTVGGTSWSASRSFSPDPVEASVHDFVIMAPTPELGNLPMELRDLVIVNLHPSAAIRLSQTNHWYHANVSLQDYDQDEVQTYLNDIEQRPNNVRLAACFSCLKLKPADQVCAQLKDADEIGRPLNSRICLDCGLKSGYFKHGTSYRMGRPESGLKVLCGVCTNIHAGFCPRCDCCNHCVASMSSWSNERAALWLRGGGQTLCVEHFAPSKESLRGVNHLMPRINSFETMPTV